MRGRLTGRSPASPALGVPVLTTLLRPSADLDADRAGRTTGLDGRRGAGRISRWWPSLLNALLVSLVYGCTLQRSTGNAFSVDTTKFELVGRALGTPHPPGYPLYTLISAAAVRLVPFGSDALRVNLLSAVFAVLSCVVVVTVLRELGLPSALQAGGATAFGLLPALWQDAVVAEVYTFSALFLVTVLACLLVYERTRRRAWLRAAVLVFALSFAHATSDVLLVPGLALYLLLRRPWWLLHPRELLVLLPTSAGLALLPYAYLPWRTAVAGNSWVETRVYDRHSMWAAMTGAQFGDRMWQVPTDVVRAVRLPVLTAEAVTQLGPLLLLAAVGLVVLALRRTWVAVLTLAWAGVTTWFVLRYLVEDWITLLLPVWLVIALWVLVGVHACVRAVPAQWRTATAVVVAVALPLAALLHGYAAADRRGPDPQRVVDAAVAAVPDGSVIFTGTLEGRQQLAYRLLPDDLGLRRRIWGAEGGDHSGRPGQAVANLRDYCSAAPGPWAWPWHEQLASPTVPRRLATFVLGDDYATQVREAGVAVRPTGGHLYAVDCADLRRSPGSTTGH